MSVLAAALRRPPDHRGPPDHLARDRRQRLRLRLGRRRPAPPGLGLAGRHRRQRAAVHRLHRRDLRRRRPGPLFGQAGRQVFFIIISIYGWQRWQQAKRPRGGAATRPRSTRAGRPARERAALPGRRRRPASWSASGSSRVVGAGWPAPRWYYWCDAWIFVGSMLATYAMARGWNDFWLAWIAVDLVGVPLLWHSRLLPVRGPVRRLRRPRASGASSSGCGSRAPSDAGRQTRERTVAGMTRRPRASARRRPARHHRARDRRHRGRQGRRRRRRRGPRERGRPHLRRQQGDPGADGVHDPHTSGRDLRADAAPTARPARASR